MNAEEIMQALQEKGFVAETFRDQYISVHWSDDQDVNVNMVRRVEFMTGKHSTELEELLEFLSDNGWRLALEYFVPIEWGFVITTHDS